MTPRAGAGLASVPGAGLVAALLLCAPPPVAAQEFTLGGDLSQTLRFDTNPSLDDRDSNDSPAAFSSITRLGLDATYATPRARWRATTSFGVRFSTDDDGDDQSDQLAGLFEPRLNLSGSVRFPRFTLSPALSFRRRRVDDNETIFPAGFEDPTLGLAGEEATDLTGGDPAELDLEDDEALLQDVEATETTVAPRLAFTAPLGPRLGLDLSAGATIRRVSEQTPDLASTTSFEGRAGLRRLVSRRTSLTAGLTARRFLTQEFGERDATSFGLSAGVERQVLRDLSFSGSAGVVYIQRDALEAGVASVGSESAFGFSGSLDLRYRTAERSFTLGVNQGVTPSSGGELRNRTSLSLGVSESLTRRQSLTLGLRLSRSSQTFDDPLRDREGEDRSLVARLSPAYVYELSPKWTARLGYDLTFGRDDGDARLSNGVSFTLTRDLELYP